MNPVDHHDDADHMGGAFDTPMRKDAFELSEDEKISRIETHVRGIMDALGLDLQDDSLRGTPKRVAKMYVKEAFGGLDPAKKPILNTFENNYQYGEMLVEKNIVVYSTCEHHLLPIVGRAHVAYLSKDRVIGLSKMNRIVDFYAKRPQVQERLTRQITAALQQALGTDDVAVMIDAKHLCVNARGIRDIDSSTVTAEYGGRFAKEAALKQDFLSYVQLKTEFGD
ncbi:MAG TPA: GTP cyclohydrolase I FolE [Cryomorphaceae bacterium]|jgi:GTP cyclohydrolase IA|nr:MAG: GTP cyclohydrolase [Cryomorphaceae bacterium BACL7 MAG-120910-bin2]KRO69446.1 MAG: GTP cyclohydrolase [Cryomorphaceae bacterium BACL7 MAG-120322-bin74]KRO82704.1 MAG: GTP cyclohydrolase [Cryomorphaceae bacterium BACL7 MAG-121220-bin83]NQW25097.1 GTP cyclohydrolase I FolE [Cryomorphaceae bacterium]HAB32481.1 GTP cyclohydrolase I FolE [Cryomorphaceae bacterium]|tara:strand:+ start:458 stop:1129 length:672 start_codon:yes stop_codon:yes gene_type:complete